MTGARIMPTPSFSEIARYRAEAPALKTIAVTHDLIGRHGRLAAVLQQHLALLGRTKSFKVLDVGAHDRAFGRSLERAKLPCMYSSLDIDNSTAHDFDNIDNVKGYFDVIAMFELIEHLPYEQVDDLLHKAYSLLAPEGRLFPPADRDPSRERLHAPGDHPPPPPCLDDSGQGTPALPGEHGHQLRGRA